MFQGALGRLSARIQAPAESLSLQVFVDAGGRASENRVWGGLAVVDNLEATWLDTTMYDLRSKHDQLCLPTGELKGSALPDREIHSLGRRIEDEDHRILFWANWYPTADHPRMVALATKIVSFLRALRADRYRLDSTQINDRYNRMTTFLKELKGINRHKVVSTIAHLAWLTEEVRRADLGPQLGSVEIVLDREDIPLPHDCAEFLRLFIAASLQAVGMSARLTWRTLNEEPDRGAITVNPNAESMKTPGVQFVDVLIQGVQRGLPGYSGRRKPLDSDV